MSSPSTTRLKKKKKKKQKDVGDRSSSSNTGSTAKRNSMDRKKRVKLQEVWEVCQKVKGFESSKLRLEQYITGAEIAANIAYLIQFDYGDIHNRHVLDLGCGTGMLSAASLACGAGFVTAVDIDEDAIHTARLNLRTLAAEHPSMVNEQSVDFLRLDVAALQQSSQQRISPLVCADTCVMNPPFGSQMGSKHMDRVFLETAIENTRSVVYSLHKSSTRGFLLRWLKQQPRVINAEVLRQVRYDLPKSYSFHKKESLDILVDLYRITLRDFLQ